jgi:hypothetical protein
VSPRKHIAAALRLAVVSCLLCAVWLGAGAGSAAAAEPPANDNFANALPFNTALGFSQAETEGATTEPGEPAPQGIAGGGSVWFEWTAEKSGGVEFLSCWGQYGLRPVVGVYTGTAVGALTPAPRIFGRSPCEYGFEAVAGVTYRIQEEGEIDPATGLPTSGEADLALRRFPANDDLEDAYDLGQWVSVGTVTEWGNIGATKQPGEPDHDGDPGGHSVWFTWTAPASGEVHISTSEADFTPTLAAYTGASVAALTPVAAGRGEAGSTRHADAWNPGQMNFATVAGTKYDIAVDGLGGSTGTFQIEIEMDFRTEQRLSGERDAGGPPPLPPGSGVTKAKPSAPILSRHVDQARRSVVFALRSAQPGTHFRCKLDRRAFATCGSKVTYRHLAAGHHLFRAMAVGPTGATGAPVKASFAIRR